MAVEINMHRTGVFFAFFFFFSWAEYLNTKSDLTYELNCGSVMQWHLKIVTAKKQIDTEENRLEVFGDGFHQAEYAQFLDTVG